MSVIEGMGREQAALLPPCIDDYIAPDALVRVVDEFVGGLDLVGLGFERAISAATGRPGYHPADMLRLYIWGYLNQVRSSRLLERACHRDLEALWLMKQLAPDYRTIAAFRHDNPQAIVAVGAPDLPELVLHDLRRRRRVRPVLPEPRLDRRPDGRP